MLREMPMNEMEYYINVSSANPSPLLLVCKPPAEPQFVNNQTVDWYIDDNPISPTNTRVNGI